MKNQSNRLKQRDMLKVETSAIQYIWEAVWWVNVKVWANYYCKVLIRCSSTVLVSIDPLTCFGVVENLLIN